VRRARELARVRGLTVLGAGRILCTPARLLPDHVCSAHLHVNMIAYKMRYLNGSPKKVMDHRVFRQRFPDFASSSLDDGLRETVDRYRGIF
jgi:hypothetical protein